jgi:hypothetical protein
MISQIILTIKTSEFKPVLDQEKENIQLSEEQFH